MKFAATPLVPTPFEPFRVWNGGWNGVWNASINNDNNNNTNNTTTTTNNNNNTTTNSNNNNTDNKTNNNNHNNNSDPISADPICPFPRTAHVIQERYRCLRTKTPQEKKTHGETRSQGTEARVEGSFCRWLVLILVLTPSAPFRPGLRARAAVFGSRPVSKHTNNIFIC